MKNKDEEVSVSNEELILIELRNINNRFDDFKENQNKFEISINNRFDDFKENQNKFEISINNRFDDFKENQNKLEKKIDNIENNDLDHIREDIKSIGKDVVEIKEDIIVLKTFTSSSIATISTAHCIASPVQAEHLQLAHLLLNFILIKKVRFNICFAHLSFSIL